MSAREPTLTEWPPTVMMPRGEHDPMGLVHRAFDRLEQRIDDLLGRYEEPMPDTEPDPRWWGAG